MVLLVGYHSAKLNTQFDHGEPFRSHTVFMQHLTNVIMP